MKVQGFKCKHCKSDDLVFVDQPDNYPIYIYHYSLDYDLGCRQRIPLLRVAEELEIDWGDEE